MCGYLREVLTRLPTLDQPANQKVTPEAWAKTRKIDNQQKAVYSSKAKGNLRPKVLGRPLTLVRQRVRYFSDGLVLGSREFVDGIFHENREKFGPKRKDGARRMSGLEEPLYSMRRLRLNLN